MRAWAESAARTGDTEAACKAADVTLAQYVAARRRDPAFDALGRLHDQVVDLMIAEALRAKAISGDARHQALYFTKVRDRLLAEPGPESSGPSCVLTAAMAEAMIRAGLGAAALPAQPPAAPPRSSRPVAAPSRAARTDASDLEEGED